MKTIIIENETRLNDEVVLEAGDQISVVEKEEMKEAGDLIRVREARPEDILIDGIEKYILDSIDKGFSVDEIGGNMAINISLALNKLLNKRTIDAIDYELFFKGLQR